ncbi:hypothetical protein CYY_008926 [Polysphondylium violaceum]|uniref:FAM192A/Fyv6 N-terminal domain-containing protein n=1 Tax=Polysphondylium violaceum TaxID=133409 RepID=A0A8J4UWJ0_9MYCE|nr:hypothetical protein CYY_008926 [Polysphondylium violaceum]
MSFHNKFISESEIEEQRKLYGGQQSDWVDDGKTLYDRLQEQKRLKTEAIIERTKHKPSQGLDKDDIEYFEEKERAAADKKKEEQEEIEKDLEDFKRSQATHFVNSLSNNSNNNSSTSPTTITTPTLNSDFVKPKPKSKLVNIKLIPSTPSENKKTQREESNDNDDDADDNNSSKKLKTDQKSTPPPPPPAQPTLSSLLGGYDDDSEEEEEEEKDDK